MSQALVTMVTWTIISYKFIQDTKLQAIQYCRKVVICTEFCLPKAEAIILLHQQARHKTWHLIRIYLYDILDKAELNYVDRKSRARVGTMDWLQGSTWKLCLDSGGGYMVVYVCQNALNCTLKMVLWVLCKLYCNKNKWSLAFMSWCYMKWWHKVWYKVVSVWGQPQ